MKVCTRCNLEKEDTEFSVYKSSIRSYCKPCGRLYCKEYKQKNKEKVALYNKKYKEENKEEIKEYNTRYNIENKVIIQQKQNKSQVERRKRDPNYKIRTILGNRLQKMFKKINLKKNKDINCTMSLLGVELNTFMKWLEFMFYGEITFANHGTVWHLDHVIPCSMFDLTKIEHQKICFHWSNIRPLYSRDNIIKNNTLLWEDLHRHYLKLRFFSIQENIDISIYENFIKNKLEYTKANIEKFSWRMGNQLGIVKIIQEKDNQQPSS